VHIVRGEGKGEGEGVADHIDEGVSNQSCGMHTLNVLNRHTKSKRHRTCAGDVRSRYLTSASTRNVPCPSRTDQCHCPIVALEL
jgi:hypothetical protein